jgi:hypothetical protein
LILDGRHLCQVANAQVIRPRRAEVDPDAHVPADFLQFRRSFTVLSASVLGAAATHIVGGSRRAQVLRPGRPRRRHHPSAPACALGDKPGAHGIAPGHHAKTVVLYLVNPVGARRRLWGGGGQARLNEARPVSGQALTHTLDQHAPNLGSRCQESNRKGSGIWQPQGSNLRQLGSCGRLTVKHGNLETFGQLTGWA